MSLSPLILERPGRWRLFGLFCIVIISFLPALPLVLAATGQAPTDLFSKFQGFLPLLLKSLVLSLSGAAMALSLGLFAGVFYSLYEFPGRKLFMFLFLSVLEDSGYIARVAFILDRVLRIFGLQGKSILAMIVSGGFGAGGCAVPGVMATRTLRDEKDRLITILVAP